MGPFSPKEGRDAAPVLANDHGSSEQTANSELEVLAAGGRV